MSRFNNLSDWLCWLETLHPKAIDMGLERVRVVAGRLQVLAPGVPVVTVAGTNGKGSTTALLESLLRAHGKRVGCYTSPHILRFNERIRINGEEIGDTALLEALARVDEARGDVSLTYFEFTTLAALVLFRAAQLDAWILEVGLGGRLDAVNVIDPDVAVLTSVGLDHQEWLGNTREEIGREKAGIFRAGRPAVIGEMDLPASVLDAVQALGVHAVFGGVDYRADVLAEGAGWNWFGKSRKIPVLIDRSEDDAGRDTALIESTEAPSAIIGHAKIENSAAETAWVETGFSRLPEPSLALINAATALQAFCLLPFVPDENAVRSALAGVSLAGRNQCIEVQGRRVILDVGHNADALRFLRGELARHRRGERFHVVLGMLADKDIDAAVHILEPLGQSWHIAPLPSPRSATAGQLQEALRVAGVTDSVVPHDAIADALAAALKEAGSLPVLVTGSFYTVCEAMRFLDNN